MNRLTEEKQAACIERSKQFFDKDKNVSIMVCTSDLQFFHVHDMTYAEGHIVGNKEMFLFQITREMAYPPKVVKEDKVTKTDTGTDTGAKKDDEPEAEEIKRQALFTELAELGVKPSSRTGITKLTALLEITKARKALDGAGIKYNPQDKIKKLNKLITPALKEQIKATEVAKNKKPEEKKVDTITEAATEKDAFGLATEVGTLKAWEAFLTKYPKGELLAKANEAFEKLFNK